MFDEVSNRIIIQSHNLARLSTELENPGDLSPGTNDLEESATHGNRADIIAVYRYYSRYIYRN